MSLLAANRENEFRCLALMLLGFPTAFLCLCFLYLFRRLGGQNPRRSFAPPLIDDQNRFARSHLDQPQTPNPSLRIGTGGAEGNAVRAINTDDSVRPGLEIRQDRGRRAAQVAARRLQARSTPRRLIRIVYDIPNGGRDGRLRGLRVSRQLQEIPVASLRLGLQVREIRTSDGKAQSPRDSARPNPAFRGRTPASSFCLPNALRDRSCTRPIADLDF